MFLVMSKRIPQQIEIRVIAESTKLLLFFDLLGYFGFHEQLARTLCCSKSLQKQACLLNPLQILKNPEELVECTNR